MGSVPVSLAAELKRSLGLGRAVETGTYLGDGARRLAEIFPKVVTIELSDELHEKARSSLTDQPTIETLHGDSRVLLAGLVDPEVATLFFLDGHWSGDHTAGQGSECPVLEELAVLRGGNPNDCLFIDDARLFAAAPSPPHDPSHWPTLIEVFDAVRAVWPKHHVTLLADQVIGVPLAARPSVDRFGQELACADAERPSPIARLLERLR